MSTIQSSSSGNCLYYKIHNSSSSQWDWLILFNANNPGVHKKKKKKIHHLCFLFFGVPDNGGGIKSAILLIRLGIVTILVCFSFWPKGRSVGLSLFTFVHFWLTTGDVHYRIPGTTGHWTSAGEYQPTVRATNCLRSWLRLVIMNILSNSSYLSALNSYPQTGRYRYALLSPSTELSSNSSDRELPRDMFRFKPSRITLVGIFFIDIDDTTTATLARHR